MKQRARMVKYPVYTHLDLSITQYFYKSNLARDAGTAIASTPSCVSVPGIAEVQFSKTEPQPRIEELQSQHAGNTLLSTEKCAEWQKTETMQMPQNGKPASQTPETTLPQNKGVVEGLHTLVLGLMRYLCSHRQHYCQDPKNRVKKHPLGLRCPLGMIG